jgi:hypothetical protein
VNLAEYIKSINSAHVRFKDKLNDAARQYGEDVVDASIALNMDLEVASYEFFRPFRVVEESVDCTQDPDHQERRP